MDIIKSSAEISFLFKEGKRLSTPYLTLIVLHHEQHGLPGRVAFVAGKKLGNAVWRNTAKRRMRSIYREAQLAFDEYDVVFLAKSRIADAPYEKVMQAYSKVAQSLVN